MSESVLRSPERTGYEASEEATGIRISLSPRYPDSSHTQGDAGREREREMDQQSLLLSLTRRRRQEEGEKRGREPVARLLGRPVLAAADAAAPDLETAGKRR